MEGEEYALTHVETLKEAREAQPQGLYIRGNKVDSAQTADR